VTQKVKQIPGTLVLLLIALSACVTEIYTISAVFSDALATALIIHLITVTSLVAVAAYFHKKEFDINLNVMMVILTAFIGVFGAAISFVAITRYAIYSVNSSAFADWLDGLFPEDQTDKSEKLYERIIFGLNDKSGEYVESYHDLMVYGSVINKQTLIARITRYFRPSLAPVLHMALQDENNIIRVQAAASITKLEDEFFTLYKKLEIEQQESPDSYQANIDFAIACVEYIHSGILGEKRTHDVALKTVKTLAKCIRLTPGDNMPELLLGLLHLHIGNPKKSYYIIKRIIDRGQLIIPELVRVFITCLFELKKYDELRRFCMDYPTSELNDIIKDEEINEYVGMWTSCMIKPHWSGGEHA